MGFNSAFEGLRFVAMDDFSRTRRWSRGTSHEDLRAFLILYRTLLLKCLSERGQFRTKVVDKNEKNFYIQVTFVLSSSR